MEHLLSPSPGKGRATSPARLEYDIGQKALHAGLVTPIVREILRHAFTAAAIAYLDPVVFEAQLNQISAHSTRVGINQDYLRPARTSPASCRFSAAVGQNCPA